VACGQDVAEALLETARVVSCRRGVRLERPHPDVVRVRDATDNEALSRHRGKHWPARPRDDWGPLTARPGLLRSRPRLRSFADHDPRTGSRGSRRFPRGQDRVPLEWTRSWRGARSAAARVNDPRRMRPVTTRHPAPPVDGVLAASRRRRLAVYGRTLSFGFTGSTTRFTSARTPRARMGCRGGARLGVHDVSPRPTGTR